MSYGAFGALPFSAEIRMWFECNGARVPLCQSGPTSIVAAEGYDLAACDGTIIVSIDGEEHRRDVTLLDAVVGLQREGTVISRGDVIPF